MFSFLKWRTFLEREAEILKGEGFEVRFAVDPDHQKMILEVMGLEAYGGFENWGTGATDYTVMALPPLKNDKTPLAYRWGVNVPDENFEALFREFETEFRRYVGGPSSA